VSCRKRKVSTPCTPKEIPSKCQICHQVLDDCDLVLYQGHPDNSVEESVALTDPKLSLFTGDENDIHEHDQRPQNKVTYFRYVTLMSVFKQSKKVNIPIQVTGSVRGWNR
jgi:DNA (cytosine-5)-methyltransferase 1